jgi:hypothetical protein
MMSQSGKWQVHVPPSSFSPSVKDAHGHVVATLHAPREQATVDAILLCHAPILLSLVEQCAEVFRVMVEHDGGPSGRIAASMHEQLGSFLRGPISTWTDGDRAA